MQIKNRVMSFDREMAVKILGRTWLVDDCERLIIENLGSSVPSVHIGRAFASLEEASAFCTYPVSRLPEKIRVPYGTAFATPNGKPVNGGVTTLFTVDVTDLVNVGILVEQTQVSAVEYTRAPRFLSDSVDCVTSSIYISNETPSRILVEHDENGYLLIHGSVHVFNDFKWEEYAGYEAFMSRQQAIQAADIFALRLLKIANWRGTPLSDIAA